MARMTRAAAHLTRQEVKNRMITDPRPLYRQRWLIIYNALVEPRKAEDIARHCGVSKATVHVVISSYNRQGIVAVETAGKGGRRSGESPAGSRARGSCTGFWSCREGRNLDNRKNLSPGWSARGGPGGRGQHLPAGRA